MSERERVIPPEMTGEDFCNLIVEVFNPQKDGRPMTADEVWNISPTGELWPVYSLGIDAYVAKHNLEMEIDWSDGPTRGDITFYKRKET